MVALGSRGPDLRIFGGYISERARREAPSWVDDWLDAFEKVHPKDVLFLVELTWRTAATVRGADRVAKLASESKLEPRLASQLHYGDWCLGVPLESLRQVLEVFVEQPEYQAAAIALVEHRLSKHEEDLGTLSALAIRLVMQGKLLRAEDMTAYYWERLAKRLLTSRAREIARTIFESHGRGEETTWFVQHSQALEVLVKCIEIDPRGVWRELAFQLEKQERAHLFVMGFPDGIVDSLPREAILSWVEQQPDVRARLLAQLCSKKFTGDSLATALLGRYGQLQEVSSEFFSAYVGGGFAGPASEHWEQLAQQLEATISQHPLHGVREWARSAMRELRKMAARERKREEEERVRWNG